MNSSNFLQQMKNIIITLEKNKNDPTTTTTTITTMHETYRTYCNGSMKDPFYTTNYTDEFINWLKEEASLGNSYANDFLGDMYYCGVGVKKNYDEAMKFFKKSADKGNMYGLHNIAYMIISSPSSSHFNYTYDEGETYYTLSAMQGHDGAGRFLESHVKRYSHLENHIEKFQLKQKIKELDESNKKLQAEIDDLKIELEYRPDGIGYQKAKEHAESLFKIVSGGVEKDM